MPAHVPRLRRGPRRPFPRLFAGLSLAFVLPLALATAAAADPDDQWSGDFGPPPGGLGLDGRGYALVEYDGDLVVGGSFHVTGPIGNRNNIARFDGTSWGGSLRRGVDGPVTALGTWGGDLYAGGVFQNAGLGQTGGPVAATNVARWDGTAWSAMGAGVNDNPLAFCEHGGALVVAGYFTEAGGAPARRVASWDGASWSPLGTGLGGAGLSSVRVTSLASFGGYLYAGGTYTEIDGTPVTGLARWDGATWSDFGTVLVGGGTFHGEGVEALHVHPGLGLLVGGDIGEVNGIPLNGAALWDGANWSAFDAGLEPLAAVTRFASYHGDPVAIGHIDVYCPDPTAMVARWGGTEWECLGSGLQPFDLFGGPLTVGTFDGSLYVAGNITLSGGKPASFFGRWTDTGTAVPVLPVDAAGLRLAVRPSPTRGPTTIEYALPEAADVEIGVLDVAGRRVADVFRGPRAAGAHVAIWDGRGDDGLALGSGVYFLELEAAGQTVVRKVVLTR